jgi:methylthioribulose-1-phosphate dehydratase
VARFHDSDRSGVLPGPEYDTAAAELIAAGRFIHERGWVPATSGNFSARLADGSVSVTVSGRHKGDLQPDDIMRVDADGTPLTPGRPSAETPLHLALYRRDPAIGAVLHPHSPAATLISRLVDGHLVLEGYELLKALEGIVTHETRVGVPIFPNDQDIPRLAARVGEYMDAHGTGFGYILAGHGFYTWGTTVADALRHVEALEHLFDLEMRLHGVKRP